MINPQIEIEPSKVIDATAAVFGVPRKMVTNARVERPFQPNPARDVAMALAHSMSSLRLYELCDAFNCSTPTLSRAKTRVGLLVNHDLDLAGKVRDVIRMVKK